ncbi:MAG: hypothetical protein ACYCX3_15955 [Thermoleophilia bacterium]
MTSVLGSAALLLAVVGLAAWVLSQLAGAQAAAERLPAIVVGESGAQPADRFGSQPLGGFSTSLAAVGATAGPSTTTEGGGRAGTSGATAGGSGNGSPTSATTARTSGTTPPTSSSPATGVTTMPGTTMPGTTMPGMTTPDAAAPVTAASPNTTMRMVIPDPMRQEEHHQSGGNTPTTTGAGAMSHSQTTGAPGSMGH